MGHIGDALTANLLASSEKTKLKKEIKSYNTINLG